MSVTLVEPTAGAARPQTNHEERALAAFRTMNPDLFVKNDFYLALHILTVLGLLGFGTYTIVTTPHLWLKILLGPINAFFWFALGNVTIHHHHTHHNAAKNSFCRRCLDVIHFFVVPDGGRHLKRYRRAHMNHHSRPLHDADVDHRYAMDYYERTSKNIWTKALYYLELTFVGAHVPGPKDESYMNRVPISEWTLADYEKVKEREVKKAKRNSLIVWGIFFVALYFVPRLAWGWLFPLILLKNWSHFLGQFQHYDVELLDPARSKHNRTKTYHIPGWLNYLAGGEISGHFLHHIYADMPYYNVERARKRFVRDPELVRLVVNY
jgi:hypothetical protein